MCAECGHAPVEPAEHANSCARSTYRKFDLSRASAPPIEGSNFSYSTIRHLEEIRYTPPISSLQPCLPACRRSARTHAFVPPPLRELRNGLSALLPSPRWRARHGHLVASSFRDACLRAAPPCIIRKCAASEAAACSQPCMSACIAPRSCAAAGTRLFASHIRSRSSPPLMSHLRRWDSAASALSAFCLCLREPHTPE